MKQQISHWTTVLDIIEAGIAGDAEKTRNYTALLADRLEEAGDAGIAARIRRVLQNSNRSPSRSATLNASNASTYTRVAFAPVDPESRSAFIDEVAVSDDEPLVLPPVAALEISRILQLYEHQEAFLRTDIPTPRSLLLYGPPGCGKTSTARYIARHVRLPLLVVRLDAVMSSFLGTTAKNLRTVFDYAAQRAAVLFLDEFDAVAKMRDDSNEVGEIKRIVNSLIQNLDAYPKLFVIAATNHEHLLDPAIWRRFDSVIALPLPGIEERMALLKHFLAEADLDETSLRWLAMLTDGCSGGDIEQLSTRARQDKILNPSRPILHLLTQEIWRRTEAIKAASVAQLEDRAALVRFIDSHTGNKMPARGLELLTGVPISTIGRIRRSEEGLVAHGR